MAYYTAAALRARVTDLADADAYTDTMLEDWISEFETLAERYCGVAFTSRSATEYHTLRGDYEVPLRWPEIASITSASVAYGTSTTTLTVTDLTILRPIPAVDLGSSYTGTLTIVYAHGYATTPKGIMRACREFVRIKAQQEASGTTRDYLYDPTGARVSTADWDKGRPTGYLDVDDALNAAKYGGRWLGVA